MYRVIETQEQGQTWYGVEHEGSRKRIESITDDKQAMTELVQAMNDDDLDVIHMQDVAEDFLACSKAVTV